ncbi:MAG: rRNA maturation RNase YbeY [Acidimicrobiia bacterium]
MNVFVADEQEEPLESEPLRSLAVNVLEAEGFPEGTEVSLVLVGVDDMQRYNERFMDRNGPTDVLAFPLEHLHPGKSPALSPNGPPLNLGDVFVCPKVVMANAAAAGVPFSDELYLMVVHGILHLLGYDHFEDDQAAAMEARETELLASVGRTRP